MRHKGLSLLEVLIAMVVMLIGSLFLLGMFPMSNSAIAKSRNTYLATELAQTKLESWFQKGYVTIQGSPTILEQGTKSLQAGYNGVSNNQTFSYTITHSQMISGGIEQVTALVQWGQHSETVITWVTP